MKKYEITQSEKRGAGGGVLPLLYDEDVYAWKIQNSPPASCQPFFGGIRMHGCVRYSGALCRLRHMLHIPGGEGGNVPSFEKYRWRHIRAKSWKCFKKGTLKLYPRGTPRPRLPVLRTQCDNTMRSLKRRWLWGAVKSPAAPPFFHVAQSVLHCCSFVPGSVAAPVVSPPSTEKPFL